MSRRSVFGRRAPLEWVLRGLLALAAGGLCYLSVSRTLAETLRANNPERAHSLAPSNGPIAALLAQKGIRNDSTAEDRSRAARLAREALRQDPTAVIAVSTLGIDAQIRGDVAGARRFFAYAESLSRRDIQTQLWAIEDAVSRGDIPNALQHYDIALRTSRNAPDLLYPILASAVVDPLVRKAMVDTLARNPSWGPSFMTYLPGNSPDPKAVADLMLDLRRAGVALPDIVGNPTINALLAVGDVDEAWAYYAAMRPGVARHRSRDPNFANSSEMFPFDWGAINNDGAAAAIQPGSKGGTFDFSVPSGVEGTVLQQVQALPPGDYRLEGHSNNIDQPQSSSPYWRLTCRDGRELGRVVVPPSAQQGGAFAGRFTVPAGCPSQMLALVVRPTDALEGVSGQIDRVQLSPMR